MDVGEYEETCLYCWGDPRSENKLLNGRIVVAAAEVRFEADDLVLSWDRSRIRRVSYEPTHPVDVEEAAGGSREALQDITLDLDEIIPPPAISIILEDPEGIEADGFDVRLVFDTERRAKLAMKRIQSILESRYTGSELAHVRTADDEVGSGWGRVDRALGDLQVQVRKAKTEEQCQQVGHLCREILISLAEAVYDPKLHKPVDGVDPSSTDAKRMLEAYLEKTLEGKSNEEARRHGRASLDFANAVQHRRTATPQDAALCAEATRSVVNIVAIISGRSHA